MSFFNTMSLAKRLVYVVVFLASFFAVKYAITQYNIHASIKEVLKETLSEVEKTIEQDSSDRSKSEKLSDASVSLALEKFNEFTDKDDALGFAAGAFAGNYGRQLESFDYCKNLNVDLTFYLNSYKKLNADVYVKADSILRKMGQSIDGFSEKIQSELHSYVDQEMRDILELLESEDTDVNSLTLADACLFFNDLMQDDELKEMLKFSNIYPKLYSVIMNAD